MDDKLHVNVDITSDIVCPWCWVGKKRLDSAMETLSTEFNFHVHWKPFVLNPNLPEKGMPLGLYMRIKFGDVAAERFLTAESPLAQAGKTVGIVFNPNRLVVPTHKAHVLLAHSATEGKQHQLQEDLFRAYFAEGKNVADESVLSDLAVGAGMDRERAEAALQDTQLVTQYREDVAESVRKGITGVPHFDIYLRDTPGMKQTVSGAQPVDTFLALFRRLRLLPKV